MSFLETISEPTRPTLRQGTTPNPATSHAPAPTPPAGVLYQPSAPDTDLPPTYRVHTPAPAGAPGAAPSLTASQVLARAVYGMMTDAGVSGRWARDPNEQG